MTSPFDISPGTASQILQTNGTSKPNWITITGDVLVSDLGVATVVALQGNTIQAGILGAGEDGYVLTWEGSNWQAQPPTGGGGGGITFSPVTFFEEVSVLAPTNDTLTLGSGNDTVGTSFILYNSTNGQHTCTGVRFYWAGGPGKATTMKCSLWQYGTGGVGTSTQLATVSISVSTTPSEYIATFGSPVSLNPGIVYSVSVYDTSGSNYPAIGALGNSDSIVGLALDVPAIIAGSFLIYTVMNGTGGASTISPFSVFHSGDAAPLNIGVNFFPVEPVLT